jgi:type I restriction enzyme S subunit
MKYWLLAKQGSTFNEVSTETVKNLRMCVPGSEEQREIADFVRHSKMHYEDALTQSSSLISLLQERRSALISAAVTGQIDVRGLVPEASAA